MNDQPEPCITGRCLSPIACGGFGYCRDRNNHGVPDADTAQQWRQRAARLRKMNADPEDILTRLTATMEGWPGCAAPNDFVQVRADLIRSAAVEIATLRNVMQPKIAK